MNRLKAQQLARSLMDKHGLHHVPFEFDRGKRRLGATHFQYPVGMPHAAILKKITLSAHFVDLLPEDEVRDVILHEIAHALCPAKEGHGVLWRSMARKVGAKPQRCAVPSDRPKGAVIGTCPNGHEVEAHRLPQRVKFCVKCPGPLNGSKVFTWAKDGRKVPVSATPQKFRQEHASLTARGRL